MAGSDILESVFAIIPKLCGSGIGVCDHTEILWQFQKFWNRCLRTIRKSVAESVFAIIQNISGSSRKSESGVCDQTENLL